MIKYGVFSEITGDKPMILFDDDGDAKDFCYSQNKNLYPKEIMVLSPIYCFIRKVDVNDKGEIISIESIRRKNEMFVTWYRDVCRKSMSRTL